MTTMDIASQDKAKRAGQPGRVEHLTEAERVARGKAARGQVPRSAHATWEPPSASAEPRQAARGAGADAGAGARADSVRADVGVAVHLLPRRRLSDGLGSLGHAEDGLQVQLCGDAHLSNFGGFAAPDRRLVFSINDFDETHPGPVRVGREAARRQLRRRRPRPRLRRQAARGGQPGGRARPTGRRWRRTPAWATSTSGTRASTSRSCSPRCSGS